jgi:protocatechuate 3,4-dioxygenase beta subunit
MKRSGTVLGIVVAVAAVVAVWWVAGGKMPFGGGGERAGTDGADGASATGDGAATDGTPDGRTAERTGPRLFGRSREERVGKGSVVGRVMDFATGKPVAGAKALLAGTGYGNETVASRVATSADGGFGFAEVPAGDAYSLRVEVEGHPPIAAPAVAIEEGRTTDLGVLWAGRRAPLAGVVVDDEGKPVADASVGLHGEMPGLLEMMQDMMGMLSRLDQEQPPLAATKTDRTGRFAFEDVAPGPQTLLVRAAGFGTATVKVSMTSSGAAEGEVRVVLRRGQVLAGQVVTTAGAGVPNARIALMAQNDPEAWMLGRSFQETDASGAFRFDTLPTGDRFQAIVSAAGYPTTFGRVEPGRDDNRVVLHETLRFTVRILTKEGDQPVEGATVAIGIGDTAQENEPDSLLFGTTDRTGRAEIDGRAGHLQMAFVTHPERATGMWMKQLGGQVPGMLEGPKKTEIGPSTGEIVFRVPTALVVAGRITGADGAPLSGARVFNYGFGIGGGGAVADADGRYRLPVTGMAGMGAAMVMVTAPGHVQPAASMMATGKADANGVVTHDVRMERAAVVTGRVVDREGRPLAGALVAFHGGGDDKDAMMLGMAMLRPITAYSAEDGSFLVDSAPASRGATITARRTGFVETTSAKFDVVSGQAVRAPDLVMRQGVTLVVRVREPGGQPAKGGRVQVELADDRTGFDLMDMMGGDGDVATGEDGVARIPNLKAGKATVTASGRGFAPARTTVDLPAADGATHEVELRLREARLVTGRVTDEAGKPLAGATVRVQSATVAGRDDGFVPSDLATADAEGKFRLEGLPDLPLTLVVRAGGHRKRTVEVDRQREGLEVRLALADPDKAKRRMEVMGELTKMVGDLQSAKDETERKALQQRMQELSAEMAELGDVGDGDGVMDVDADTPPQPPAGK